jgi:hypothetical protein
MTKSPWQADSRSADVKNFVHCMEHTVPSPCSRQPATGHCPWPDESNPHPASSFLMIAFNIVLSHMAKSSDRSLPFRLYNQNFVCTSQLPLYSTCLANLILLGLIILTTFGENPESRSPSLCNFSSLPLFHPCLVQIFSSAPFSQTPSIYSSLNAREKLSLSPTHIKPNARAG